jgi:hypothetical protein
MPCPADGNRHPAWDQGRGTACRARLTGPDIPLGTRARHAVPLHWIVVAIAGTAILVTRGVAAQDATPTPDVPPPELCRATPRTFDELNAVLATPVAIPAADPTPIPEGRPTDPETIAGISATLRELVACFNADDVLRAYGLYTDRYLRRIFSTQDPLTQAAYDAFAPPHPVDPDERSAILAIADERLFDDGSAGAYVTIRYAVIPVPKTFFFTFVRVGDRWLIDGALGEISFSVP